MAKTKTIENFFISLAIYSDLLPIIILGFFFKNIKNRKVIWILCSYLLFDFIINFSLLYFIPPRFHNTTYPVFTFVESLFFSIFFYSIIKRPSLKKLIIALTVVFLTSLSSYFYYVYFIQKAPVALDSIPIGIETLLVFLFSFLYFFEQMNDTSNLFIYNQASFWGVLGILLYLSGSFFIYIFANEITIKELSKYWIITNISSVIKNVFFAIAIFLEARQSLKKPPKHYNLYPTH